MEYRPRKALLQILLKWTAHGEILIKRCPEIADAGNRLNSKIPDSDRFKLDLARL